jgi:hypothetical protein
MVSKRDLLFNMVEVWKSCIRTTTRFPVEGNRSETSETRKKRGTEIIINNFKIQWK